MDAGSPVECRRQRAARRGLQQPERTGFVRVGVVVGQAGRALLGFSTSPLGLAWVLVASLVCKLGRVWSLRGLPRALGGRSLDLASGARSASDWGSH